MGSHGCARRLPDGYLPDSVKNSQVPTGMVLAVGTGPREASPLVPVDLEAGDRVRLTGYASLEMPEPSVTRFDQDESIIPRERHCRRPAGACRHRLNTGATMFLLITLALTPDFRAPGYVRHLGDDSFPSRSLAYHRLEESGWW